MQHEGKRSANPSSVAKGTIPICAAARGSARNVIGLALLCNATIALAKFAAAAITGSAAMLAEGIHSGVDIGNQLMLLYGLRRSRQPPDEEFPFGYGKEVYFWCFVIAIEVFTVGAGVAIARGVWRLMHPGPLEHVLVNFAVLGIAFLFEGISWIVAISHFSQFKGRRTYVQAVRQGKDPTRFMVVFEDSAALLGLMVAAVGTGLQAVTGNSAFDAAASIIIGVVLAGTAAWLAFETKGLLIGESANRTVVDDIRRIAAAIPGIQRVIEVLSMHIGPDFILVAITLEFERPGPARERAIDRLEDALHKAHPRIRRVFVRARHPYSESTDALG